MLITKDGTIGKTAIVTNMPGKASLNSGIFLTRPIRPEYIPKYMYWLLNSEIFTNFIEYMKTGTTINHLYQNVFVEFAYPIPNLTEQSQIALFLDHETSRIDNLIQKKNQQIELLKEKRSALITHAVTKGLNPNAKMKDSGIEWIGEIPEHWDVIKIRRITKSHKQGYYTTQSYSDKGIRFARITDIDDNANVLFKNMPFIEEISEKDCKTFEIKSNDFLFARSGTIGRFGLAKNPDKSVFASYLIRFRFDDLKKEFIKYFFMSHYFKESLISTLHGGANQNIHAENIKDQILTFPSTQEEQSQIADYLDKETSKIDTLISKVQISIEKLKEYRTALISAAVTGKIDVREWNKEGASCR